MTQEDRRNNGIVHKLAVVGLTRDTVTHMIKFVKSVSFVDGIAIVERYTDQGVTECFYKPEEISFITLSV